MKQEITVTELRSNIYAIIDGVINTGEPVTVHRNNQNLTISLSRKTGKKKSKPKIKNDLSKMKTLPDALVEDDEFYRSIDWEKLLGGWYSNDIDI
ncbi:MAG: hypothetical protein R3D71_09095 [Rickettsiales bacterium]